MWVLRSSINQLYLDKHTEIDFLFSQPKLGAGRYGYQKKFLLHDLSQWLKPQRQEDVLWEYQKVLSSTFSYKTH